MTQPWGFDLSAIEVPVSVWYGPDDVLRAPLSNVQQLGQRQVNHRPGRSSATA
jgi:hypothetical protein